MGEVATTLKAFESELAKALVNVPQQRAEDGHDSTQLIYVALSRLNGVVAQYAESLCKSKAQLVLAQSLLHAGEQLERRDFHSAAHNTCYSRIVSLNLISQGHSQLDSTSCHVQACIRMSHCLAHQTLLDDQQLRRKSSVSAMCKCLGVCNCRSGDCATTRIAP
jgi:hypothetical protein